MKPTYRIKDWDDHFETAESRKLKSTRWVPMPTKHDGKGYRRITQHVAAVEIFCAWNLLVQVASKMPKRGILADEDGPLDADDLSVKTGFPAPIFVAAFDFLSSAGVGWILLEPQQKAGRAARVRQSSSPEGKGMEGNGKEGNSSAAIAAAPKIPDPNLSEPAVRLYRDVCHITPNHEQRIEIVATVERLDLYGDVLRKFMSEGRPPQRVDWTLERYAEALPVTVGQRNGSPGPPDHIPTDEEIAASLRR